MKEITDTQLKLRDASIQMKLAIKDSTDSDVFRSCINSFISHARSVTLIMQEESSANKELKKWYKDEQKRLEQSSLLKFFNNKRIHSIHKGVVSPIKKQVNVYDTKSSYIKASGQKTLEQWQFKTKMHDIKCIEGDIVTRIDSDTIIAWYFDGVKDYIPGDSGNVLRLCEEYFIILRDLVYRWNIKRKELETE